MSDNKQARGGKSNKQPQRSNNAKSKSNNTNNANAATATNNSPPVKFILRSPLCNAKNEPVNNSHWCFTGGYVGLFGDVLDNNNNNNNNNVSSYDTSIENDLIPESYRQNQKSRDSNRYHMTLMLKNDFKKISERVDELFGETLQQIEQQEAASSSLPKNFAENKGLRLMFVMSRVITVDDMVVLGLGRVNQGSAEEAYFRVIEWESANRFLERCGLGRKDFHVTVGFKNKDIHNVSKNAHTLVARSP